MHTSSVGDLPRAQSSETLPLRSNPKEWRFAAVVAAALGVCALTYTTPALAAWVGFAFAAYSAVANDSIQTLGTFLASNASTRWWILWLFIGGIFLATVGYSFWVYSGDVTFERLSAKGFAQSPTSFAFLQIASPVLLWVLTRLRMPVSTTFLLLSSFSSSAIGLGKVLSKSLLGYGLAFVVAGIVWWLAEPGIRRMVRGEPGPFWRPLQWVTSGTLWAVWLMQDAANVAVFLPRKLGLAEFAGFAGTIFVALGALIYLRGGRIQSIVLSKTGVTDVRAATLVDLVYAAILYVFKIHSKVPMSTTWVFLGLLAGREVAMHLRAHGWSWGRDPKALRGLGRDAVFALIGLVLSIVIALVANEGLRESLLG